MERKDRVQDTTATTGTGPFTLDAATIAGFRTFGSAHTVGATLEYFVGLGSDWELIAGTLVDATHLTRTTTLASSNAGNPVSFGAGSKTIFETVAAASIASFLTAADGVDVTTLTAASSIADADSVLVIQGGTLKLASAAVMKAYYGAGSGSTTAIAPGQVTGLTAGTSTDTTQVLSWSAPATGTAPFTYKVEKSPAGANTWTTANASVSGLAYTVTGLTALTSYDYRVSATNTVSTGAVSATVTRSTVADTATPTQTITVNNPGPQTVGVTYTASGAYANGTPTALDFSVDGGTNWTAATSPTITGGTFSFPSTPSTASTSRNMMVRDHTTLVSGTSTAYVVSAAAAPATMASQYVIKTSPTPGAANYEFAVMPAPGNISTNGYFTANVGAHVARKSDGAAPDDSVVMTWTWGTSPTTPPVLANQTQTGQKAVTVRTGGWDQTTPTNKYYGLYNNNGTLYIWGAAGNKYLWLFFPDGSAVVYDNGTGTPIPLALS